MLAPVVIHSWFKPHAHLTLDGAKWVTNGFLAIRADIDGTDRELAGSVLSDMAAKTAPVSSTVRENGFAVLDGYAFSGYAVDLVDAAFPGAAWLVGSEDTKCGWAVARIDGALVGVVMCILRERPDEVCKAPKCPVCDGHGGPECETCEGSGETECSHCGHEPPAVPGSSLAVYVDDSARRQDTIAALDDAVRVMANPLEEVRAWLVADLHAMGRPVMAAEVARAAATATVLAAWASEMEARRLTNVTTMLSPRTRAALGIGG